MKERIIQFGEGNFLRGFVDYFVHKLNEKELFDGSVVVVQPIASGLVDVLNGQNCVYNLYLRGIENGKEVCEHTEIHSISRGINPYADYEAYLELAHNPDIRYIISNTTEAGIAFDPDCKLTDKPALSFPGKLTQLLLERFNAGLPGFEILCCELIDHNATELKACLLKYAEHWNLPADYILWLTSENNFHNTLVDRIVTGYPKEEAAKLNAEIGYEDKLLDTAEIFHLWVIEGNLENELPLQKAGYNVIWTDDVTPFKKMKVRVLNGAHTSMVFPALLAGIETVGDCLKDEQISAFLSTVLNSYVLPVLGNTDEAKAFAAAVMERFANPYIHHLLKSIALNSTSKYSVRVLPTLLDYKEMSGSIPKPLVVSLAALIRYYKTEEISDTPSAVEYVKANTVTDILNNADLWGVSLTDLIPLTEEAYAIICDKGIREAITWALS